MINDKFDLDLAFGKDGERWVELLGKASTMEVKTERDQWLTTGNIFFEFESREKPSGIKTTQAHYWATVLSNNGKKVGLIVFETETMVRNLRRLYKERKIRLVTGGDYNSSKAVLVPLRMVGELFQ